MKTKSEFLAELATLLGGYMAEQLTFKEITTGAANDLLKASNLARKLVKEYGMSALGPIAFGKKEQLIFLGREMGEEVNYSEKIAAEIDKEVAKFIKHAQSQAKKLLIEHKDLLEKIAKALIEKETIEKQEFERLLNGKSEIEPETRQTPALNQRKIRSDLALNQRKRGSGLAKTEKIVKVKPAAPKNITTKVKIKSIE